MAVALLLNGCHLIELEIPGVALPTVNVAVPTPQVTVVVPPNLFPIPTPAPCPSALY